MNDNVQKSDVDETNLIFFKVRVSFIRNGLHSFLKLCKNTVIYSKTLLCCMCSFLRRIDSLSSLQ